MVRYVLKHLEIVCNMPVMNNMEQVYNDLEAAQNPGLSEYENGALKKLSDIAASTKSAYLPIIINIFGKTSPKAEILLCPLRQVFL